MREIIKGIKPPENVCDDKNCPYHGQLSVRGKVLEGVVVNDKMQRVVSVQVNYLYYVPKYKRYERRRSKIHAYNPPCIKAVKGDVVKIAECRPINKTTAFVIVSKGGG